MNRDIAKYVLQLRDRVTRRQHHVLLVLACHHQEARETYWPSRPKLAAELQMDESQLRRLIGELEAAGILKHIPGIGAGNRSSFIFVEFEKGDVKGDKKGDFFDPAIRYYKTSTEPLQEQRPPAFDCDLEQRTGKSPLVSSSDSDPQIDDDTNISLVVRSFEQSPITTGKAKLADRATARELLKRFSPEQIEYGIVLAGARRTTSILCGNDSCRAKVQSLAYFSNVIEEAVSDPNMSASYRQYLQHVVQRNVDMIERITEDTRIYGKKEPQKVAG